MSGCQGRKWIQSLVFFFNKILFRAIDTKHSAQVLNRGSLCDGNNQSQIPSQVNRFTCMWNWKPKSILRQVDAKEWVDYYQYSPAQKNHSNYKRNVRTSSEYKRETKGTFHLLKRKLLKSQSIICLTMEQINIKRNLKYLYKACTKMFSCTFKKEIQNFVS